MITISLITFTAYVVFMILMFGIPTSLSNTYYLLENKKKGAGVYFILIMYFIAFTMVIPILDLTPDSLQIFAFLPIAGIGFVGAAPLFKGRDSKIHKIAALTAGIGCILWVIFTYVRFCPVLLLAFTIANALMLLSKTLKCYIFWVEITIFYSMYIILMILK